MRRAVTPECVLAGRTRGDDAHAQFRPAHVGIRSWVCCSVLRASARRPVDSLRGRERRRAYPSRRDRSHGPLRPHGEERPPASARRPPAPAAEACRAACSSIKHEAASSPTRAERSMWCARAAIALGRAASAAATRACAREPPRLARRLVDGAPHNRMAKRVAARHRGRAQHIAPGDEFVESRERLGIGEPGRPRRRDRVRPGRRRRPRPMPAGAQALS